MESVVGYVTMIGRIEYINSLLSKSEDEHVEFKEARNNFDFEKLLKYCVAIANEGGGRLVLGVTDRLPRQVVGSTAFVDIGPTQSRIIERLHMRVSVEEIRHPDGRVVLFEIPSRPIGMPLHLGGTYWMRSHEDVVAMSPDHLKRIFSEGVPDFSADICVGAAITDLDNSAIDLLRKLWTKKSGKQGIANLSDEQLLRDAELIEDRGITYAALILLGNKTALSRYLSHAEIIFEYRSNESPGPAAQREEFKQGFLLVLEDLWRLVNLRNDVQHFQDGLFVWDISTFSEAPVREVLMNALSHRDYRLGGSIFVRQYPRRLEVVSPGGFPPGVTPDNALWKQYPRNRRIAETLSKCGVVDRSGQGMDKMFEQCIREGKPKPDFVGTDEYQVSVTLYGEIRDAQFIRFLEKIGEEKLSHFKIEDFLILDVVSREQSVPERLKERLPYLVEKEALEKVGQGRGTRYVLSKKFYSFVGKRGLYTRKKGLDHETNKALLLKHIRDNASEGSRLEELCQVLPSLTSRQVQNLLQELKTEQRVVKQGHTRGARWRPAVGS